MRTVYCEQECHKCKKKLPCIFEAKFADHSSKNDALKLSLAGEQRKKSRGVRIFISCSVCQSENFTLPLSTVKLKAVNDSVVLCLTRHEIEPEFTVSTLRALFIRLTSPKNIPC